MPRSYKIPLYLYLPAAVLRMRRFAAGIYVPCYEAKRPVVRRLAAVVDAVGAAYDAPVARRRLVAPPRRNWPLRRPPGSSRAPVAGPTRRQ